MLKVQRTAKKLSSVPATFLHGGAGCYYIVLRKHVQASGILALYLWQGVRGPKEKFPTAFPPGSCPQRMPSPLPRESQLHNQELTNSQPVLNSNHTSLCLLMQLTPQLSNGFIIEYTNVFNGFLPNI